MMESFERESLALLISRMNIVIMLMYIVSNLNSKSTLPQCEVYLKSTNTIWMTNQHNVMYKILQYIQAWTMITIKWIMTTCCALIIIQTFMTSSQCACNETKYWYPPIIQFINLSLNMQKYSSFFTLYIVHCVDSQHMVLVIIWVVKS